MTGTHHLGLASFPARFDMFISLSVVRSESLVKVRAARWRLGGLREEREEEVAV